MMGGIPAVNARTVEVEKEDGAAEKATGLKKKLRERCARSSRCRIGDYYYYY